MITAAALALALALPALAPTAALAVSLAECEAYLCLPGGFPPSECTPAKVAVTRRLAALQPALPPWSSCTAAFGWDSANVSHTERRRDECPRGGTLTNGSCRGTNANGCTFRYTPRKRVTVQVVVDGATAFSPNRPHTQTVAQASTPVITCPAVPIPTPGGGGEGDGGDGDDDCENPPCDVVAGCENPPCEEECENPPCDDDCENPPCDVVAGCENPPCDDDCPDPVPSAAATGGPPFSYRVAPGCPCPFGYPIRIGNSCVLPPHVPVN